MIRNVSPAFKGIITCADGNTIFTNADPDSQIIKKIIAKFGTDDIVDIHSGKNRYKITYAPRKYSSGDKYRTVNVTPKKVVINEYANKSLLSSWVIKAKNHAPAVVYGIEDLFAAAQKAFTTPKRDTPKLNSEKLHNLIQTF